MAFRLTFMRRATAAERLPTNAALRAVVRSASAGTEFNPGVPVAEFIRRAVAETATPGSAVGDALRGSATATSALPGAVFSAIATTKRGVYVDTASGTIRREPNVGVKHSDKIMRCLAQLPAGGAKLATLRQWVGASLSDSEFDMAISRVFDVWCDVRGDMVVPRRPGSSAGVRAAFQALQAAPQDGVSTRALLEAMSAAEDRAVGADELRRALGELALWFVPITGAAKSDQPDRIMFCDWSTTMRRVQATMPPEGTVWASFLQHVIAELCVPRKTVPANIAAALSPTWVAAHFANLFVLRTARTDGVTVVVSPRLGVDTPGLVADVLQLVHFHDREPPVSLGWRPSGPAFAAMEQLRPAAATVGFDSWADFVERHPALETTTMVEIRPRATRSRSLVFVDASSVSAADAEAWIQTRQMFDASAQNVEWQRIALRHPTDHPHAAHDVVTPAWLGTEHVLGAQIASLSDAAQAVGVDRVIVLCAADRAAAFEDVLRDVVPASFSAVLVITADSAKDVREAPV